MTGLLWWLFTFLCVFIIYWGKPATATKYCVKGGKTRHEKERCSQDSTLRRADRYLARAGRVPSGSWLCLRHRNSITRNDQRCSCPSSWGHSSGISATRIPVRLYVTFDAVGSQMPGYMLGTNWCNLCRVVADNRLCEHETYCSGNSRRKVSFIFSYFRLV